MSKNTLFVYGSLMSGMAHHSKIKSMVKEVKAATCEGELYRLPAGHPAMLDGTKVVRGEILTFAKLVDVVKILDEYEGYSPTNPDKSLFVRMEKPVMVEGAKKPGTSQVYILNRSKLPKEAVLVESGDYRAHITANPPLSNMLSESQKRYILKLGASSGRDIVPINLDIYRDLLNKGLIVDKGRRLALTNLGTEVFRFLS